jgi:hypothetical protein
VAPNGYSNVFLAGIKCDLVRSGPRPSSRKRALGPFHLPFEIAGEPFLAQRGA